MLSTINQPEMVNESFAIVVRIDLILQAYNVFATKFVINGCLYSKEHEWHS